MCPLYRGCELIVAKSEKVNLGEKGMAWRLGDGERREKEGVRRERGVL